MSQPDAPVVAIVPEVMAEAIFADPVLRPEGLSAATGGGFAALFAQSAAQCGGLAALIDRSGARMRAGAALVARQRVLERLLPHGDALAVAPGASLAAKEAGAVLAAHSGLLAGTFCALAERVQYQVLIGWDPAAALRHWRGEPELAGLGSGASPQTIASAAEALRSRIGAGFAATVAEAVEDAIALPLDGPERLANLACLLRPNELPALEAALEDVDAAWPEGLSIRLIGPTPALSFAAVTVECPAAEEEAAAAALLGVEPGAAGRVLRQAFRARVRSQHPDTGAASGVDLDRLREAESLLARLAAARDASGLPHPILLGLRREPGPDPAARVRRPRVEAAA